MQQRRTRSGQSGVRRGAAAAQITEVLGSSDGDVEPQSSPAHWDAEDAGVASSLHCCCALECALWIPKSAALRRRLVPLGRSCSALLLQTFGRGMRRGRASVWSPGEMFDKCCAEQRAAPGARWIMEAAQAYFNVLDEGAGESRDVSQEIHKCEYQGCVSAAGAFFCRRRRTSSCLWFLCVSADWDAEALSRTTKRNAEDAVEKCPGGGGLKKNQIMSPNN